MRPVLLKLSAFGPYAEETAIPMNELGEKGLYLICGDTGAGKTTVFDGICYALFGRTSGDDRENKMLRSKYAKPETKTYVELTFINKNKKYIIKRNPEYIRPKDKGVGETKQVASVAITMPDGEIITKETAVSANIKDILGVDREQFCKISMIAQGEFRKLLMASTDERVKIFRDIFGTIKYQEMQSQIYTDSKKLSLECNNLNDRIAQYIDGIICDESDRMYESVKEIKDTKTALSENTTCIVELIHDKEADFEKLEKSNKSLLLQLDKANLDKSLIKNIIELRDSIEKNNKIMDDLTVVLNEAKENLHSFSDNEKAEKIRLEIINEESSLSEYEELNNLSKQVKNNEDKMRILSNDILIGKEKYEKEVEKIVQLSEERLSLEGCDANLVLLESNEKDLIVKKSKLTDLKSARDECIGLKKKYELLRDECESKLDISNRANEQYNDKFKCYIKAQAGILAKDLQEDSPCPVCGSKNHPKLAKLSGDTVTGEELDKIKEYSEKAQKDAKDTSVAAAARLQEFEGSLKSLSLQWNEILEDLIDITSFDKEDKANLLDEQNNKITVQLKSIEKQLDETNQKILRKNKLDEIIQDRQKERDKINSEITEWQNQSAGMNTLIQSDKSHITKLKKKLKYKDLNEAQRELILKKEQLKALDDEYKKAKEYYDEIHNKKLSIQAIISSLNEQLNIQNEKADEKISTLTLDELYGEIEILEKTIIQLKDRKNHTDDLLMDYHYIISNNKGCLEKIEESSARLKELQRQWQIIDALNKTANGANNSDIKLETYVQMAYFDKIINRANLRLMVMSGNQYEMRRIEEEHYDKENKSSLKSIKKKNDGRKNFGLDLEVIDHYNGTTRSVKTLSGGESFLASLSLALGMSDEIQQSVGGIKLDTMFIDEGFGSLDEESLTQAVRVLQDLSGGNKLVGIISHVRELEEKIERKIIVKKKNLLGSYIEVK